MKSRKKKLKQLLYSVLWLLISGSFIIYIAIAVEQYEKRKFVIFVTIVLALLYWIYKIFFKDILNGKKKNA